eukprot:4401103-Pyramimonas_sp.AAC.1
MQAECNAASRDAQLRAPDLAEEVWHLWLASEENGCATQRGTPAAGCRKNLPVHLGALKFIVDAGCADILIAERCIRAAGAMGRIE